MKKTKGARNKAGDLMASAWVTVLFFAYMLTIAFAPELFRAPVAAGSNLSMGLALGVALAIFLVAMCAWYTHRRNGEEQDT